MGYPKRVIRLVENMQDKAGAVAPPAPGKIVFSPRPDLQRLRGHALADGTKSGPGFHFLVFRTTCGGDLTAFGFRGFGVLAIRLTFPLQAYLTNSEIIRCLQIKNHDFGVKDHLLQGLAPRYQFWRFIRRRLHLQDQGHEGSEADGILPGKGHLAGGIHRLGLANQTAFLHGGWFPINARLHEFPARSGLEGGLCSFEQTDRSATNLDLGLGLVFQIVRELQTHFQRSQFRPRAGLQPDGLADVTHFYLDIRIALLGGDRELVAGFGTMGYDGRQAG